MIHCEKCGICRVGKEGEIFHCDPCGACFMEASRASHVCTGRSSVDTQCHFCFEYVHHSQTPVVTLPCNHMVHEHCAKKALGSNCYRCPVCRSAMVNMQDYWDGISVQIDLQPMPEEYRRECKIDCFDCHKQSSTNFHFLGLMCPLCRGYNTSEA
jgi:RING finger and CHY zinc finger domain-containing protein 1